MRRKCRITAGNFETGQRDIEVVETGKLLNIRDLIQLSQFMHQTNSMQQSPSWNANRNTASIEIPHTLWNPNVHYRNQKSLPPVPILSHINPIHAFPSDFLQIHSLFWHLRLCLPSGVLPSEPVVRFCERGIKSNVYWTVHHCNSWRMKDQLDVTCYFISLIMCSTCFGH